MSGLFFHKINLTILKFGCSTLNQVELEKLEKAKHEIEELGAKREDNYKDHAKEFGNLVQEHKQQFDKQVVADAEGSHEVKLEFLEFIQKFYEGDKKCGELLGYGELLEERQRLLGYLVLNTTEEKCEMFTEKRDAVDRDLQDYRKRIDMETYNLMRFCVFMVKAGRPLLSEMVKNLWRAVPFLLRLESPIRRQYSRSKVAQRSAWQMQHG